MNLLLVNGSVKGICSGQHLLLLAFTEGVLSNGNHGAIHIQLCDRARWDAYAELIDESDTIVVGCVFNRKDGCETVLEFLEYLVTKELTPLKRSIAFILLSDVADDAAVAQLERKLEHSVEELGCICCGIAVRRHMGGWRDHPAWVSTASKSIYHELGRLYASHGNFDHDRLHHLPLCENGTGVSASLRKFLLFSGLLPLYRRIWPL